MKRFLATAVLFCVPPTYLYAQGGFSAAYYFGDSMTDTGNSYDRDGVPASPPYHDGNFTNGLVWAEYLAADLGLANPEPSRLGGPNYAWGAAQTGDGITTIPDFSTLNIGSQIDEFVADGRTLRETDLVVLWGGINDVFAQIPASVTGQNMSDHFQELYDLGGRRFLVSNVAVFDVAAANATNTALSRSYQSASELPGIEIAMFDFHGFANEAFNDPGSFGFTADFLDNACPECTRDAVIDPSFTVTPNGIVDNPDLHFFWDGFHPTTAAHRILADMAVTAAMTIAVPEPSTGSLFAISSFLGMLGFRRTHTASKLRDTKYLRLV